MQKVTLCFIAFDAYPLFNSQITNFTYTGADIQLYILANELAKDKNFDISFVVGNFNQEDIEEYNNIKVYKYEGKTENLPFIFHHIQGYKLYKLLKKINSDIYIQRSASTLTGQISSFTKFNNKKFVFMAAHEKDCDLPYTKLEKLFGHYLYPVGIYRYLFGIKSADVIITQTREQYNLIRKSLEKNSKFIRSAYPIPQIKNKNGKYILWVARCVKWKHPELFIELAKQFPEEDFVMICPGEDEYKNLIKKEAENVKNLKFIDQVHFSKIDNYFKNAKIFVNTSKFEGFPNSYVQAAKNKTPILTLNINPDNVINVYSIGLHSYDLKQLASDLKNLLTDKQIYKKLSDNAYDYAKQHHNIDKIKEEYKSLFLDLKSIS